MEQHLDVLGQLAELRKWHEENCDNGGLESNNSSIALNSAEQARIYKLLGLSPSFICEIETSQTNSSSSNTNRLSVQGFNNSIKDDGNGTPSSEDPVKRMQINNDLSLGDSTESTGKEIVRRPFLKRGEGLTNRFKVDPDRYKLHNLPKYKFANHRKQRKSIESKEAANLKAKKDISPPPSQETTKNYQSGSRKSCLKAEGAGSQGPFLDIAVQMKELGVTDYEESEEEEIAIDENVKRMLDFSRPKVTFDSEVIKIPFENYFQRHDEDIERPEDDSPTSSDEDEIHIGEDIINNSANMASGIKEHGVSSTPVEVLKSKHLNNSADKSPRTVLVEKGSLLRENIRELEEETAEFRELNKEIIKMKQTLELERVELKNKRQEMERSLKDERMKMEQFFQQEHDKLERDRAKMEQQSKQPSKKIKEEIKGLQDRIEELEKDLKARELKHGASQTRLRCHIRTLEKENKENAISIESLKKENKKLEMENSRLLRQKNNKTLMEINKNIAKLASTTTPTDEQSTAAEGAKPATHKSVPKMVVPEKNKTKPVEKNIMTTKKTIESQWNDMSSSESSDDNSERESTAKDQLQSKYFPNTDRGDRKPSKPEKPREVASLDQSTANKKETVNEDGSKDILYANGNIKKVSPDGMLIKMLYFNKDIKETNINEGTVKYYYSETKTWHTSYLDGLEILEFPSGQTEHRFKNGKVEIYFPNGQVRVTNPGDRDVLEEWRYPDGTVVVETRNREKIINLPNGQKEIHTADHKRREYPDGTVKIVYSDGRTETCYSNGRIRIKDKDGNLISDSQNR